MTTADDYVNTVIGMMPPTMAQRTQIGAELRSHIAERLAHGHTLDAVLGQLGDPATLADSYLSAEPLVSASFGSRAVAKVLDGFAVLAVVCPIAWAVTRLVPEGFGMPVASLVVLIGGSLLFGVYTMTAEYRHGQTIGKRCRVSASSARSARAAVHREEPARV